MRRTSLFEEHVRLAAKMVEFGGWQMPLNYPSGVLSEHLATRKSGGLFDISHMGRFMISGQDALAFLQYVLSNNAAALQPGESQYTIIANENGGAVDDTYLYGMDQDEYLLVVNAANAEKDWAWLQKHRQGFPRLTIEDRTEEIAMLSLQGPRAKAVLELVLGDVRALPDPTRNRLKTAEIFGAKVPIARTGYTGEPIAFELFPPAEMAVRLWNTLLEVGKKAGIVPVGLGARDTLRLEAGLPLYGHELGTDEEGKEIPVFAMRAARSGVSFAAIKGEYIGREALMKQFQEISLRRQDLLRAPKEELLVPKVIRPLAIYGGGIARPGCQVYVCESLVGTVVSGTMIPYWEVEGKGASSKPGPESNKRAICLAYLDADLKLGQEAEVVIRNKVAEAVIVGRHASSVAAPYARPIPPVAREVISAPPKPRESLKKLSESLVIEARDNTLWRQRNAVNLIPSEQTASTLVRLLSIADPSGRYGEHRRIKALGDTQVYYYQGTGFMDEVEQKLVEEMKEFLGCSQTEVRVVSGQMANTAVFSGVLSYLNRTNRRAEPRRFRKVMNHHIGTGGHLSAQAMGALKDYVSIDPVTERAAVVNFPISADNPYRIDLPRTAELIERHKPELLIFGKSMVLHLEPVKEVAEMIADVRPRPIVMYDAAHVLGLLGPGFQCPLQEGADILTGSTHKTFFGTQRGMIASNMSEGSGQFGLWRSIVRRVFPGSVSNHHLGTMLGLLMAAYEMNTYGRDYQTQVLANARAFALALKEQGLQPEGDPKASYTETHQVVLRVGYAKGIEIAERLEASNIIVNYQALPDDEGFGVSSGLRTGVQEMTRFGMKEGDFEELAGLVADVVLHQKDVSREVSSFRKRFTEMQYCLPEEQAKPLVDELLGTLR